MLRYKNFSEAYVGLLNHVYNAPEFECSPRGMKIRESLGVQFCIEDPRDRIPYIKDRDFSIQYMVAELLWYMSANNSTEWISNYSAFWSKISDDGLTANSAYGARIFKPHARIAENVDPTWSQWRYIVEELKADPDSRRAVVHIRSPQDSLLAKLDVPCTLTLQFFLRDDKVYMVTNMRSSDLILGIAYDVPAFTLFQEMLANDLSRELGRDIGLGSYVHISNSLHIYERHFEMTEKILKNSKGNEILTAPMPPLPEKITRGIKFLSNVEHRYRQSQSVEELCRHVDETIVFCEVSDVDECWSDWAFILASHRAGKLNDPELKKKLILSTSFGGYQFFVE